MAAAEVTDEQETGSYRKLFVRNPRAAPRDLRSILPQSAVIRQPRRRNSLPGCVPVFGIMTFIVDPDGGAYAKDLGSKTVRVAAAMTTYRLDRTWTPAEATPWRSSSASQGVNGADA
jgi:hypothetical protein